MSDANPTSPQDRRDPEASSTADPPRDNPAGDARTESPTRVLTLVCENCGKDYFFDDEPPEPGMRCEKCGGTVFRSFHASIGDEVADDFRDSTERDLDPDDAEGDVLPGDVMDLKTI